MLKAISLTQPWASLMVLGYKQNETRKNRIIGTGEVCIHATREANAEAFMQRPFLECLVRSGFAGPADLPTSAILGVVRFTGAQRTKDIRTKLSFHEEAFGDYSDGRWAFTSEDSRELPRIIPCRGYLHVWDVPEAIEEEIRSMVPIAGDYAAPAADKGRSLWEA